MSFSPKYPHQARIESLPEGESVTAVKGNLGYIDSSGYAEECGADPAIIDFVFAEDGSNDTTDGDSNVRVWRIQPGQVFTARSNTTTAQTHAGDAYGVVLSSSTWYVDISDTSNKRVKVIRLDPRDAVGTSNGRYDVEFLSAISEAD